MIISSITWKTGEKIKEYRKICLVNIKTQRLIWDRMSSLWNIISWRSYLPLELMFLDTCNYHKSCEDLSDLKPVKP